MAPPTYLGRLAAVCAEPLPRLFAERLLVSLAPLFPQPPACQIVGLQEGPRPCQVIFFAMEAGRTST